MAWRQSFDVAVIHNLYVNRDREERRLVKTFDEKRLNTIERNGGIITEQKEAELRDDFLFFSQEREKFLGKN